MLVEQLIGRYAGEIRNMAPHVARQVIASGRGRDVRSEVVAPVMVPPPDPEPPEKETGVPVQRGRKRSAKELIELSGQPAGGTRRKRKQ